MGELAGRVAVVTGAASGIGRAAAAAMAGAGATVVLADRDAAGAEQAAAEIGGHAAHVDVADAGAVEHLVDQVLAAHGRIDILHNHAGVQVAGALEQVDADGLDRSFSVNLRAVFVACRRVAPAMRAQGVGVILNTASNAGVFLDRGMLAYITTKSALITMTKQMALDLAVDGIRVNALCPGWVDTGFNVPYTEQLGGRDSLLGVVRQAVPLGRFGTASEMAQAALFLVSDRSSFITGHALVVDGGECLAGGINSTP